MSCATLFSARIISAHARVTAGLPAMLLLYHSLAYCITTPIYKTTVQEPCTSAAVIYFYIKKKHFVVFLTFYFCSISVPYVI